MNPSDFARYKATQIAGIVVKSPTTINDDWETAAHNAALDFLNDVERLGNLGQVWDNLGMPDDGASGNLVDQIIFSCLGAIIDNGLYEAVEMALEEKMEWESNM